MAIYIYTRPVTAKPDIGQKSEGDDSTELGRIPKPQKKNLASSAGADPARQAASQDREAGAAAIDAWLMSSIRAV